jgi:hypothetical protein
MFTTSAERFFAATSNETRVRVDASKNRIVTLRPRSAGTLAIGRARTSRIASVVSMTSSMSGHDRTSTSRRWR